MVRRSLTAALAATFLLSIAATAQAQDPPTCAATVAPPCVFEHDAGRDGTPSELVSGFFGGDDSDDSNGDTLDDRVDNSYEAFDFTIPEGTQGGNFTVNVTWVDARVDLDLYVYRRRPDGTIVPARSPRRRRSGTTPRTRPTRRRSSASPSSRTPTWPSSTTGARTMPTTTRTRPTRPTPPTAGSARTPRGRGRLRRLRDARPAQITNQLPTASLSGPDAGRVGRRSTYTAQGSDTDGRSRTTASTSTATASSRRPRRPPMSPSRSSTAPASTTSASR